MKIQITGCSGYIAGSLIPALRERGHEIYGIDRKPYRGDELAGSVTGDLLDSSTLKQANLEVDCICHLAAAKGDWGISRHEYYRNNLEATQNVIDAGLEAGVNNWVFYSTVSTLGPHHEAVREEAGFNAINPYGTSKVEAEKRFRKLAEDNPEARVLIIRPSVVYGPGNPPSTNIYRLVDAIYNRRFAMVGPGDAIKSTSYIENLVAATLFLMQHMKAGLQTYIYVDEPALTTRTLVERIYKLLDKSPPSWHIPTGVALPIATVSDWAADLTGIDFPVTAARIEKFNRSTNFDASKIREAGFEQPVSNEEALLKTVEWHLWHEYDETLSE
ncbi:nucleoside-diphosphate-sugar epimerase [Salinibacter ruber]|uniref:NAD-dependent epimerase/dehydratase family protein n=1 Tax=Salinibacter ruber TaxID=146919 RepID=UPI000E578E08|nr:NAD-dependent epimerase/dehydratase family protein [Salinibacter ruber]MCS3705894.1 nucleoside-diphosphate-sugar epimerase [Salinibacter ruber]